MATPGPEHDGVHAPHDDPRWRESYYFSFFDPELEIGGFSSIGKRPLAGRAGFINVIWGAGIPTLVASEYDNVHEHDDHHAVRGLLYDAVRPFGPWRLRFEGGLNNGGGEIECDHDAIGPTASSGAPTVDVAFEMVFTPAYEPYLYAARDEWRDLFDGHVDEIGAVEGELSIGGTRHRIRGRGAKDHSWGVRDWVKPDAWRWVDLVSETAPELALWRAELAGDWVGDGALYGRGRPDALSRYEDEVEVRPRAGKPIPSAIALRAASDRAELRASGEVIRVVPIRFGRDSDGIRLTSWNDRALVRCAVGDGSEAWANVEFESLLREPR